MVLTLNIHFFVQVPYTDTDCFHAALLLNIFALEIFYLFFFLYLNLTQLLSISCYAFYGIEKFIKSILSYFKDILSFVSIN